MPVAPFWDGTLTKADFAMYNFYRIIKFEMFQDTIKTSGILDDINQAVSNYGDTLVFAETNITGLERWDKGRNSTTASTRFLERRFNDSTVPEKARVQYYLAARITTDEAISPHAFDSAEGFNLWRGIVISFLNTAKGAFLVGLNLAEVCGYVNSGAGLTNINFNNTDLAITAEDAATEIEAKLRLQAGRLDSLLSNLFRQMKQNSTKFNNYGYTKAFTEEQVRILINGDWRDMLKYSIYYNRMFSVDGGTERMQGEELPGYLFGIANTNAGTTAGGEASLKHFITVGGNPADNTVKMEYPWFPGMELPAGITIAAGDVITKDPSVICKIFIKGKVRRAVNYGNAYEWVNRYLDETQHGLVFGYGELFVSNGAPVFTIKATNTTAVAANTTAIGVPFAPGGLTSENIGAATTKIDPYVLGSLT